MVYRDAPRWRLFIIFIIKQGRHASSKIDRVSYSDTFCRSRLAQVGANSKRFLQGCYGFLITAQLQIDKSQEVVGIGMVLIQVVCFFECRDSFFIPVC
ncbi:MAG: hypothetical protein CMH77_04580 [Nitrospinae bacterium]|nr:hypothetical protein [Nitrospinota bacterium]